MKKEEINEKPKKQNEKQELEISKNKKFNKIFFIVAIILIAMFSLALTPVTLQNDTYYTIKIGEQMMETGIDMQDHFSWHQDLAYTYPHWLYDLITYQIYSAFGLTGIFVATCILSMVLGVSLFLVNNKITKNKVVSFILSVGAMYLIKDYIAARAQLVTFILFIWMIYCIEMFLKGKKKRYAIGIIGIATLIANLHVAVWPFLFVLFLPYIAEYVIAILADMIIYRKTRKKILELKIKYFNKKDSDTKKLEELKEKLKKLNEQIDRIKIQRGKELENPYKIRLVKNDNVRWLIVIMVICAFTGLITPLGDTPYTYLAKTMEGNTTQNINEHLPMTLSGQTEALATVVIFLAILIFTKTKIRLSDLFMIGGLCYLMLASRRQLSMFALVGSIVLNRLICNMLEMYYKEPINEKTREIGNRLGLIAIILVMLIMSYHFANDKVGNKYVDETTYPVQACDYILNNIDLGKAKFYNEYNYGSYMIYRGIPVFIDSRADLYAPEFSGKKEDIFMDFINVSSIGDFYEDTFEKYGITHAIMYKNAKISMIIDKTNDPNYKKIYEDDYFVIYERLNT